MTLKKVQNKEVFEAIMGGKSLLNLYKEEKSKNETAYKQGYVEGIKKMKCALQNYDCGDCDGSF